MKARNDFQSDEEFQQYLKAYFAGLAMQGLLSNPEYRKRDGFMAHEVVDVAQALVHELFNEDHLNPQLTGNL